MNKQEVLSLRTKGAPNMTPEKRANILALKRLRLTTQKQIAEDNGIAEMTVRQIERGMPPEELELAKQIELEHKEDIKRVRNKALNKLEDAIDTDRIKPEALIPAYGTLYDKLRLETNQSTQNIAHGREKTPDEVCRAYVDGLISRGATIEQALIALEAVPVLNGASVEDRARYAGGQRVAWKLGG